LVPDRAGFEAFYAGHLPRVLRAWATAPCLQLRVEEAGKPIYIDVVATQSAYREHPEMLLYLLNSIRFEVA
jgi:hypothetical protein